MTAAEFWAIAVPLLVALAASAPGFLALIAQRRKNDAEAVRDISEAAAAMVNPLRDRIVDLEAEVKKLKSEVEVLKAIEAAKDSEIKSKEAEISRLRATVGLLSHQIRALGHEPIAGD